VAFWNALQPKPDARARLVLADDHPTLALLLRGILEREFEVLATVPDGLALVAAARRLAPDAIVSDISMPGLDGVAAATQLLREDPRRRVVLVTSDCDAQVVRKAAEIGVLGLVTKAAAVQTLVPAVRAALAGRRYGVAEALQVAERVEARTTSSYRDRRGADSLPSPPPLPPGGRPTAAGGR
jgi:DNA-binding NarL/FixJ family response regulator